MHAQQRARLGLAGMNIAPLLLAGIPAAHAQSTTGGLEEIIVTARKREEDLQSVPLSIQAIGTERIDQLQIKSFTDYVQFMPSVTYTTLAPGFSLPYFRGVADGGNNNHSGPQPTVGMYLDEAPITTIQGPLDIHMYDIARVEALAGPQGTLYGASSEAGTIRIITNKPDPSAFSAAYGLEGNTVAHGGNGYVAEGYVNMPLSSAAAVRLVGWAKHDAGYIDNVPGTRTYPSTGACVTNSTAPPPGCVPGPQVAKNNYNDVDTYGGRAALRVNLNENWTITPTFMGQAQTVNGLFAWDPSVGDLKVTQFFPDTITDDWWQASLTVEGKIGNFDLVYAGSYLNRNDVVDSDYSDYTFHYDQCCQYVKQYWYGGTPDNQVTLPDPSQHIHATDGYTRQSHELRISSAKENRFRFDAGLFYEYQTHDIFQRYKINGLTPYYSVTGWPETIWLTNQLRTDTDQAVFGELYYDITPKLTATAGLRWYKTEDTLRGFFGYNINNPFAISNGVPTYGEPLCFSTASYHGAPCTNLNDSVTDRGAVPKGNLTYRFDDQRLVYATYSRGFRPGGINRNGSVGPYKPDYLSNYEIGWKTTWLDNRLRVNGALFHEDWTDIQFSFLPPGGAGLTVVQNAGSANIDGIEADLTWRAMDALTISAAFTALDARLTSNYVGKAGNANSGDRLPTTPVFKGNMVARYTFPVAGMDGHLQAAVVYTGSNYSQLTEQDRAIFGDNPAYTVANFSAGVKKGPSALELYLNNAFDELARTYTYAECVSSVCGSQPYYVPNQPRTLGLKFSQDF